MFWHLICRRGEFGRSAHAPGVDAAVQPYAKCQPRSPGNASRDRAAGRKGDGDRFASQQIIVAFATNSMFGNVADEYLYFAMARVRHVRLEQTTPPLIQPLLREGGLLIALHIPD